jgi:2-C-methyl-D-erythritol 4-phosphate cytidylyltransferase
VVVVAAPPGREDEVREALEGMAVHAVVSGGETRQDSVFNALGALPEGAARVLIHDAARPCVSPALVRRVAEALDSHDAVVPAVPVVDTLVREMDGRVQAILDRTHVSGVQTPQGFATALIVEAHRRARERGYRSSDDGSLVVAMGEPLATVPGDRNNIKVTFPEDVAVAEIILTKAGEA